MGNKFSRNMKGRTHLDWIISEKNIYRLHTHTHTHTQAFMIQDTKYSCVYIHLYRILNSVQEEKLSKSILNENP
jgi:hypothetical protein